MRETTGLSEGTEESSFHDHGNLSLEHQVHKSGFLQFSESVFFLQPSSYLQFSYMEFLLISPTGADEIIEHTFSISNER